MTTLIVAGTLAILFVIVCVAIVFLMGSHQYSKTRNLGRSIRREAEVDGPEPNKEDGRQWTALPDRHTL